MYIEKAPEGLLKALKYYLNEKKHHAETFFYGINQWIKTKIQSNFKVSTSCTVSYRFYERFV
jgi:hypothetical protein